MTVESGSFGYFLEVKAVLATYTSFFDVFIDLFGFSERSRNNVFVNQ